MSAAAFVQHARSFVGSGVKWRHRGRKPWALDCVGLLVLSAHAAGLEDQDIRGYGREPWDDLIRTTLQGRFGDPVTDPRAGDVAVIRWNKGEPSHLGIVGDHPDGGLTLIHMHNVHGAVEQSLSGQVLANVLEYYRPWRA